MFNIESRGEPNHMTLYMIAIAFSAGIISAMVGAFQECMLAGLVMVAMTAFPQYSFLGDTVSYGLFPYIAFTGGVVATAYASKVRKHDLGGAAILTSLTKFQDISVLLVAAAVSILSMITAWLINKTGWVIDAGSVSVIFYSCLTRKFLGDGKFLNRSMKDIPRYSGNKKEWIYWAFLGLAVGFMAGGIVMKSGNPWLPFFLSLASLVFWFIDPNFPPTHHITCTAGYAMLATGSLAWAAVWGMIASVVSTIIGDAINTDASTHIDPPATSIGVLSILIYLIYYIIL